MNSMIKKYRSEQDAADSELLKKLHLKGNMAIISNVSSQTELDRIYNELCQLLGQSLYQPYFIMINKIWWNAQQWIGIVDKINIEVEKEQWINNMLTSIDRLKTGIKSWCINSNVLSIFAFIHGGDPDLEPLRKQLDDLNEILLYCRDNMQFKRGKKYSKDKIQRHAVYGLFCLAEAIGLSHEQKPSKIYKFVHIITGIDQKDIGLYYKKYKNTDILQEIKTNRIFEYIFSPDYVTNEINQHMLQSVVPSS